MLHREPEEAAINHIDSKCDKHRVRQSRGRERHIADASLQCGGKNDRGSKYEARNQRKQVNYNRTDVLTVITVGPTEHRQVVLTCLERTSPSALELLRANLWSIYHRVELVVQ